MCEGDVVHSASLAGLALPAFRENPHVQHPTQGVAADCPQVWGGLMHPSTPTKGTSMGERGSQLGRFLPSGPWGRESLPQQPSLSHSLGNHGKDEAWVGLL